MREFGLAADTIRKALADELHAALIGADWKDFLAGMYGNEPRQWNAKLKGQDVISLGVGEPDFVTPWHIREAAIFALEKGKTYYTSNLGTIELRRAISASSDPIRAA